MEGVTVVEHPLVQHKLTLIRDKDRSTKSFRELLKEIGMLLCYEVTRDLPLTDVEIDTPLVRTTQRRLAGINSSIRVTAAIADLTASNVNELLGGADVILDGTDNFDTRYLINDFAVSQGIPWIYGAAVASYGLTMPVIPGKTCCLKCVYPEPPSGVQPTCETSGVLNTITSLIASGVRKSCAVRLRWTRSLLPLTMRCIATTRCWQ